MSCQHNSDMQSCALTVLLSAHRSTDRQGVHRVWLLTQSIMKSKWHLRCVWRSNFRMIDKLAEQNLLHTAILMNYSCQQSLTLFSRLIFSITPTFPSLSVQEQQQKPSQQECIHSLHYPFPKLPTIPNDCSPSKLLKKSKHLTSYRNGY